MQKSELQCTMNIDLWYSLIKRKDCSSYNQISSLLWNKQENYRNDPVFEIALLYLVRDNSLDLGLVLNVDWFNPFKKAQYSAVAIYLTLLNLPRNRRFKKYSNLVGILLHLKGYG